MVQCFQLHNDMAQEKDFFQIRRQIKENIEADYQKKVKAKKKWLKENPQKNEKDYLLEARCQNETQREKLKLLFNWAETKNYPIDFERFWEIRGEENTFQNPGWGRVYVDFYLNGIPYDLDMPEYINANFDPSRFWDTSQEYVRWKLEELGFPREWWNRIVEDCYQYHYNWCKYNYVTWTSLVPKEINENAKAELEILKVSELLSFLKEEIQKKDYQIPKVIWCDFPNLLAELPEKNIIEDGEGMKLSEKFSKLAQFAISFSEKDDKIATGVIFVREINLGFVNQFYNRFFYKNSSDIRLYIFYTDNSECWGKLMKIAYLAQKQSIPAILFYPFNKKYEIEKKVDLSYCKQYKCVDASN